MILNNISDRIVFSLLKNIDYGHLEIKTAKNNFLNLFISNFNQLFNIIIHITNIICI